MARYIDADLLLETMRERYDEICDTYGYYDLYTSGYDDAVDAVENAPTADVAPRAEVAREIFWEMDKLLLSITIDEEAEESFVGFDFDKYIALKKKYTQSEPPEGDES